MKPSRSRRPLRLKAALFALSIVAMTTQVGGATAPAGGGELPAAQVRAAAAVPLPGERELLAWLAWLTSVLRGPPVSGSWALLIAGISGVWAIGRRRMSAPGGRSLDPYRLRRR